MIIGAHVIIQSRNPAADLDFVRRLGLPSVAMGDGFMIHGLPPSEVAIHNSTNNDVHEFYLMCDDVADTVAEFEAAGLSCSPVEQRGWGAMTMVTLPGGGKLGVYEPFHPRPKPHMAARKTKKTAKSKKAAKPKRAVKRAKKVAKKAKKKARRR
jgi:hypothetical protein